jgi:hypothetical protein
VDLIVWHKLGFLVTHVSNHCLVSPATEHSLWGDLLASPSDCRLLGSLRSLIVHGSHSLLLLLLQVVHVDVVSLVDLADEEGVVRQELLRVDGRLVQEHTGDDSGDLLPEHCLDGGINTVSDEVLSVFTLHLLEVGKVNLG